MFQSVMSYLIYRFHFHTHMWYAYYTETHVTYETDLFHLPLPPCLYVSVNTQQQICLCSCLCSICSMAQRLWVVVVFSSCGYQATKPIPQMAGTTTKEEGGCQGWVWAERYLREEQLVWVWSQNRKI